jgi:hypothetical protein
VITGLAHREGDPAHPAFRNMNAVFEEASRVAGAGTLRTALRITVPVMAPAILSVLLLGTMVSLQTFEVETGAGAAVPLLRVQHHDLRPAGHPGAALRRGHRARGADPPRDAALVLAQQWLTRGRRYTTVTGQFQPAFTPSGAGGYPPPCSRARWWVVVRGSRSPSPCSERS